MSDAETLATYAQKAVEYADLTRRDLTANPAYEAFTAMLPQHSHILDLGCGPGHFAAAFAQAGHSVTAVDAVPEMVEQAAQHAGVTAVQATFDDIAGTDIYDAIWANFSLLHAPRADLPRILFALHATLKPQGILHIAMKTGAREERDTIGRLYTYVTEPDLTDMLQVAGFTPIGTHHGRNKGLSGEVADWIAVRAHG